MLNHPAIILGLCLASIGSLAADEPNHRAATCGPKSPCAIAALLPAGRAEVDTMSGVFDPKGGDVGRYTPVSGTVPINAARHVQVGDTRYIGPKGGDTRKGHSPSPRELWVAIHGPDAVPATAASPKPWYIGPKGGDTRKGAR